jgi:hypothetical protein
MWWLWFLVVRYEGVCMVRIVFFVMMIGWFIEGILIHLDFVVRNVSIVGMWKLFVSQWVLVLGSKCYCSVFMFMVFYSLLTFNVNVLCWMDQSKFFVCWVFENSCVIKINYFFRLFNIIWCVFWLLNWERIWVIVILLVGVSLCFWNEDS